MQLDSTIIFLSLLVAALISFSATPVVMVLANKIGAMDVPKDKRRMHKKPIPRIGGLAIFYGFIISVLCFGVIDTEMTGILIGSVIIVTVGFVDDIKALPAWLKLIFQIAAAAVVVYSGVRIEFLRSYTLFGGEHLGIQGLNHWSIPATIIWIVGITNAVNLIDGLDGLAVGVSSIVSMSMVALILILQEPGLNVAILMAAAAGAGFGFLPYNFNPAKIFMGDTGSTFLGFMLACSSIQGFFKVYALVSFVIPILILGLPIFDTGFAIIRRLFKGQSPMKPDRGHLHHRLLDYGFTHRQTVAILYTMTAALCLAAVVQVLKDSNRMLILISSVVLLVMAGARYIVVGRVNLFSARRIAWHKRRPQTASNNGPEEEDDEEN